MTAPSRTPIALTMGEPGGIGGEIALKAWAGRRQSAIPEFFIIDDVERLRRVAQKTGIDVPIKEISSPESCIKTFDEAVAVLPLGIRVKSRPGTADEKNSGAVIKSIETAVDFAMSGRVGAVVTNPINKASLKRGGFSFPGHTEFLAHLAGSERVVMMLASPALRVALVTVHVSLKDAIASLDAEEIARIGTICNDALKRDFAIEKPVIAVAGLNPHAGEEGMMGDEEITIITPAIDAMRAGGIDATGPMPPDTMFSKDARAGYDMALCMYHDQGLIPLKTLDFEGGVNITLGLPFIRTSPDHGTALGIAGSGKAGEQSLVAALLAADEMRRTRARGQQ